MAFPKGQPNELILAGADEPKRVRIAGEPLEHAAAATPDKATAWRYDAGRRAVVIRFTQPIQRTDVRIDW